MEPVITFYPVNVFFQVLLSGISGRKFGTTLKTITWPRPVHNRIPNFKGAYQACDSIKGLEVFNKTCGVKVDPDKPLEGVRLATLQARKTLLVPTPRLRTGLFNKIVPPEGASKDILKICSTSQGVKEYSVPIGLDAKVQVDLVMVGSVAVSEKGWRIGKGEGFADMEYAMMVSMGAVSQSTIVVTIVHDCQVVDIPEELVDTHDLTVDYILTPSKVIKTECKHPNPKGIIWSKVDLNLLGKIPILKKLREMEKEAGKDVTLKTELPGATEKPSSAEAEGAQAVVGSGNNKDFHSVRKTETTRPDGITTVYIGNIPQNLSVREFKTVLREHDAVPLRLNWQGAKRWAFLDYKDPGTAESVVAALKGLSITGSSIRAELAKSQRSQCNRGPAPRRPKSTEAESTTEVKSLS